MKTKLEEWLFKNEMSQAEFSERLAGTRKWNATRSQLNKWVRGRVKPGRSAKEAIEKATKGQVLAEDWK